MSEQNPGLFEMPEAAVATRLPAELTQEWENELVIQPKSLEIVVDNEQVERVLGTLLNTYANNGFPYNQDTVRLPHDPRHMPESLEIGSRDHAMLLWSVCYYMRGGIKSVDAFKRMGALYNDRPDLYQASIAAATDPLDIAAELKNHGLGFQKTVSQQWVTNAKRLSEKYDGDPRNIFEKVETYEDAVDLIRNNGKGQGFVGFQEKMVSMITYYLMDENLIEPFMFPIPVDLHVMRISIANKMVTFPGAEMSTNVYSPELLATLRNLYVDYAVDNGVDPLTLCNAVWLMSESSCGDHPGNITLEPLGRYKRDGRATVLVPKPVNPNDPAQMRDYDASCRQCPLDDSCEINIPGKQYYVRGNVLMRGRRLRFPINENVPETLFDL